MKYLKTSATIRINEVDVCQRGVPRWNRSIVPNLKGERESEVSQGESGEDLKNPPRGSGSTIEGQQCKITGDHAISGLKM